jgi:hypothetical protein
LVKLALLLYRLVRLVRLALLLYRLVRLVRLTLLLYRLVRLVKLALLLYRQRLLDLNYSPLSTLNEANLTSATQTLNFNPTMHYQAKTSQPDGKIRN